jgi:hypothetical protein
MGRPQLRLKDQHIFKRTEQTKFGLIHEDDDEILLGYPIHRHTRYRQM